MKVAPTLAICAEALPVLVYVEDFFSERKLNESTITIVTNPTGNNIGNMELRESTGTGILLITSG